jgi:hypothetical protein
LAPAATPNHHEFFVLGASCDCADRWIPVRIKTFKMTLLMVGLVDDHAMCDMFVRLVFICLNFIDTWYIVHYISIIYYLTYLD